MAFASTNRPRCEIVAAGAEHMDVVRTLFREYAAGIAIDLCFQNFEEELAMLPGQYAPPDGGIWLARLDREEAGCIALRPMEPGIGELKRLYVRPSFRRAGVARRLVTHALAEASRIGYRVARLDTLRSMTEAIALYTSVGFRPVPPYRSGEPGGICYFESNLDPATQRNSP